MSDIFWVPVKIRSDAMDKAQDYVREWKVLQEFLDSIKNPAFAGDKQFFLVRIFEEEQRSKYIRKEWRDERKSKCKEEELSKWVTEREFEDFLQKAFPREVYLYW